MNLKNLSPEHKKLVAKLVSEYLSYIEGNESIWNLEVIEDENENLIFRKKNNSLRIEKSKKIFCKFCGKLIATSLDAEEEIIARLLQCH